MTHTVWLFAVRGVDDDAGDRKASLLHDQAMRVIDVLPERIVTRRTASRFGRGLWITGWIGRRRADDHVDRFRVDPTLFAVSGLDLQVPVLGSRIDQCELVAGMEDRLGRL